MSALQEIAGNIEQYPKKIREAKEKKRYTINDIVDLSGVSKSAVSKLLDGSQMDPKLYNSVAMCLVVYLFIDSQITAQGLIRNGQPTAVAWFVIAVAATAVIASTVIISMALRKKV